MYNNILTKNSKKKIDLVNNTNFHNQNLICPKLHKLFYNMKNAFSKTGVVYSIDNNVDINSVKKNLIDFDSSINNIVNSKFQSDVMKMNILYAVIMELPNNMNVRVSFLANNKNKNNLVAILLHSLSTFCLNFPCDYNNLTIIACLDDNKRDLYNNEPISKNNSELYFFNCKTKSIAFNVSGVTYPNKKTIILTKSEEIVKLMYHELIHYIGLDHNLYGVSGQHKLPIMGNLNLSEAYAEFFAIILNCIYQTLHCKEEDQYIILNNMIESEIEYSLILSSNILVLYGYNSSNVDNFFLNKSDDKHICPIPIWEYVLFRTCLMNNIHQVCNIVDDNWFVSDDMTQNIIKIMTSDDVIINKIKNTMNKNIKLTNISYLLIEFDWIKF